MVKIIIIVYKISCIIFYRANFKNQFFEIDLNLPLFKIESRYEVNGQILVLPIKGNGKFIGNFSKLIKVNYIKYIHNINKNNLRFIIVLNTSDFFSVLLLLISDILISLTEGRYCLN